MQVVLLKCVMPVERSIHARDSYADRTFYTTYSKGRSHVWTIYSSSRSHV
ncbi:hypothetical protein [Microcoleus sp. herbarium12]